MAKRRRSRKRKRVGEVVVRAHTRTPRGPNKGKGPVKVKGYTRSKAKPR